MSEIICQTSLMISGGSLHIPTWFRSVFGLLFLEDGVELHAPICAWCYAIVLWWRPCMFGSHTAAIYSAMLMYGGEDKHMVVGTPHVWLMYASCIAPTHSAMLIYGGGDPSNVEMSRI